MSTTTLRSLTLVALGVCTLGTALPSYAATSASVTASSMYLWRGQSISGAGPAISGDLNYSHDIGFYAGLWTSSEGNAGSHETDLTVGFTKKFGDFGFDVGLAEYLYPESGAQKDSLMDTDAREWYVGAILGPVTAKVFINPEENDNKYITVDAMFGKFGVHAGSTQNVSSAGEYNDFNVSYMPVDNLTFTMSVARGDGAPIEAPLFAVSYKWPFEVK